VRAWIRDELMPLANALWLMTLLCVAILIAAVRLRIRLWRQHKQTERRIRGS
jgi:hypothetical protein